MKKMIAIPLVLLSSSAMAGVFVPVHVAPPVVVHVAPTLHVAPTVAVHPGVHPHLTHKPVPVVVGTATPGARKCNAKAGAKDCPKN